MIGLAYALKGEIRSILKTMNPKLLETVSGVAVYELEPGLHLAEHGGKGLRYPAGPGALGHENFAGGNAASLMGNTLGCQNPAQARGLVCGEVYLIYGGYQANRIAHGGGVYIVLDEILCQYNGSDGLRAGHVSGPHFHVMKCHK